MKITRRTWLAIVAAALCGAYLPEMKPKLVRHTDSGASDWIVYDTRTGATQWLVQEVLTGPDGYVIKLEPRQGPWAIVNGQKRAHYFWEETKIPGSFAVRKRTSEDFGLTGIGHKPMRREVVCVF